MRAEINGTETEKQWKKKKMKPQAGSLRTSVKLTISQTDQGRKKKDTNCQYLE